MVRSLLGSPHFCVATDSREVGKCVSNILVREWSVILYHLLNPPGLLSVSIWGVVEQAYSQ